jgi:hypothetical protein
VGVGADLYAGAGRHGTYGPEAGVVRLPEPFRGCEVRLGRMPLYGT